MAYQYHPHNHYAAADGGVLGYHPHQLFTDLHTMNFPATAQPPTQPDLFLRHYIYCEETVFYNYPPDFAATRPTTHGGAQSHLLHHHHPNFIEETTVFHNVPAMHGVDHLAYDGEVVVLDGPLFLIAADDAEPMAPPPQHDDGLPEEVVAEFLKKMTCEVAGEPELCAVCQDDLCQENQKIVALNCKHRFHGDCVGKWLQMKNTCPLCKAIVINN